LSNERINNLINKLVIASDPNEVISLYEEWAECYDRDLDDLGYVAPQLAIEAFTPLLKNFDDLIYDAGCGTGIVGSLLNERGYNKIVGADFSEEMRKRAENTNAYTHLEYADYGKPVDVASSTYDAVISVGVYTARFEGVFLQEMLRILKPSSPFLFSCRPHYYQDNVKPQLEALHGKGLIESINVENKPYMLRQNADAYYITLHTPPDTTN